MLTSAHITVNHTLWGRIVLASTRSNTPNIVGDMYNVPEGLLLYEVPPPPENLNEVGRAWWNYYCGLFVETKILSRMFIGTINNLCFTAQCIEALETSLNAEGLVTVTVKKYQGQEYTQQITNPMLKDLQSLYSLFSRLANDLGITPFSAHANAVDTTGGAQQDATPHPPETEFAPPVSIPMVG